MGKIGASPKLINVTNSIYKYVEGCVRLNGQISKKLKMEKGMKQGDCLSPLLFIIFIDQIIKQCKRGTRQYKVGNWKMREINIQAQVYADDIILIAKNKQDLQLAVAEWAGSLEERGMKVNCKKSKVMKIGKEQENIEIKWEGEILEQVSSYDYLGVTISEDGK